MATKFDNLAAQFLSDYGDTLSNRGCNDPDPSWFAGWTESDKRDLVKLVNQWNNELLREGDEDWLPFENLQDWMIAGALAQQIRGEIG